MEAIQKQWMQIFHAKFVLRLIYFLNWISRNDPRYNLDFYIEKTTFIHYIICKIIGTCLVNLVKCLKFGKQCLKVKDISSNIFRALFWVYNNNREQKCSPEWEVGLKQLTHSSTLPTPRLHSSWCILYALCDGD